MTTGTAVICRRGHVLSVFAEYSAFGVVPELCPECGATVITTCPSCGSKITGGHIPDGGPRVRVSVDADAMERNYRRPNFCTSGDCGVALPWADRQARIWEIENRLVVDVPDEHDRLVLREQLEALLEDDLDEGETERRWQRIAALGGRAFTRVMTDVGLPLLNAKLRKDLGL